MMRQMREATKPIMLFTAVAFVALMVFQWGMDITGRSSGSYGQIGSVNGAPVTYDAYMASYRNLYDQVQRSQQEPINTQQNKQIEDAAFDEVVNQVLIRQELDRRGITVTDQEIQEAAQYSPPSDLRSSFADSTGNFDLQAYQSWLSTLPQEQLVALEAYYRDVIPRGKLLRQVSSGIFLSDADLWSLYRDAHETATIEYVPLNPATRYTDADFPVAQSEIEAYYAAHQKDFEVPAKATVKAVVLNKAPTPADTAAARDKAVELRKEIVDGADFADVARRASVDSASAKLGGDLGTFPKGRMTPPFDSAAFSARIGRVSEPVETSFGYHLIEVQKRWGQDSAQARHILIPIQRTDSSEIQLLTLADSLEAMAAGNSLEEAAKALGESVVTADLNQNFPFLVGAGQINEGADWVFTEASPGDVSPVFEDAQAFYALELVSSQPAGVMPLDDARTSIEATLRLDKKMERAREDGAKVVERTRSGEALPNVAADMSLEVRHAGPFTRNDFVPGIGRQNAAVGTAFALKPGQVSDVVTTPTNAFVIEMDEITPADSSVWLEQKDQQRQNMASQEQQQRLQEWIEALRKAANIQDNRDKVLRAADDTTQGAQLPPLTGRR